MPYIPQAVIGAGGSNPSESTGGFLSLAAPLPPIMATSTTATAANAGLGCRVQIGQSGTLRDLAVYIATSSGNISLAVYNTASPRARLATSGAVVCPAGGAWRTVFDPAMSVTAGDQYDFFLSVDNNTASFGIMAIVATGGTNQLPGNFLPAGGGSPWMTWSAATVHPAPATISEASFVVVNAIAIIVGRIA